MNREPEEFYLERNILRKYREGIPEYSTAARRWPLYAVEYWDTVGPIVKELFARHFNFMQWALEYARETYPEVYGPQSPSNDAILDLTDVLYDGTFSPLHISAALGLEQLCLELMEKPEVPGAMFRERAASPLFCSLAGSQIFTCRTHMAKWHQVIHQPFPELRSRLPVIRRLLELHRQKRIVYESTGRKGRLLVFLAFRATVLTGEYSILKSVLQDGGDVRAVIDLINDDEFSYYQPADPTITSKVLSSILDLVLAPSKLNLIERDRQALIDAIQDAFLLNAGARVTSGQVDITDAEFQEALKDAFLDDSIICFRRLIHHPSFDPNAPSPTGLADGTILHHAVCDGLVEFADVIVECGGNLDARDHMGRTPLLLCNDTETLAMLVKEHGAKTTAVDHQGRNIWHYAASTNDIPMLMWLAGHDSYKHENLRARTKQDATPMDLALKSGLKSLDANNKIRLDATIVLQVLLSNGAPHADEVEGMRAELAISKILKSQPRPGGESFGTMGNMFRDNLA
ncbi:ankyrin repeat-containing domain protein [Cordyceps fumosorosea ARSEF 2679]|uniref:Ankyrin repeat-containing domain protein n=1 Tax=Cordyceps fumosorosea (strain ARSEF 2679) TaxID=1081104 RepID=A0A167NZG3_CORFA|nr:ankyrin repeat-containing domain protein [Cordyceps fumosorosea ARSEF 2679]OAA56112.1 ankyrin repeat-containing domain protein [Cordyceps fumosorosea ARSEF 2679]